MTPEIMATLTRQVTELVQTYSNNYPQFQRATYNETQVRVDFVNRFLEEDRLTVSDPVIIEIFQSLYYPNNSYEFGVIDPYIIGQI